MINTTLHYACFPRGKIKYWERKNISECVSEWVSEYNTKSTPTVQVSFLTRGQVIQWYNVCEQRNMVAKNTNQSHCRLRGNVHAYANPFTINAEIEELHIKGTENICLRICRFHPDLCTLSSFSSRSTSAPRVSMMFSPCFNIKASNSSGVFTCWMSYNQKTHSFF